MSAVASGLYVADSSVRIPLEKVKIEAVVLHANTQVQVTQHYRNPTAQPVETEYFFPLDNRARVVSFAATLDGRTVTGCVKEKAVAEGEYKTAKDAGQVAALLGKSERTNDVWSCKIGNMPAQSSCTVTISYVAEMRSVGTSMELHLPTSLAPRYAPADQVLDGVLHKNLPALSLDPVGLTLSEAKLDLSARFFTSSTVKEVGCHTHKVRIVPKGPREVAVLFAQLEACGLTENFVVTVDTTDPHRTCALRAPIRSSSVEGGGEVVQVTFRPCQESLESVLHIPSEFIFVVDQSGSMRGEPTASVKRTMHVLLRSLPTQARFNVIAFGSTFAAVFPEPCRADDPVALRAASDHIEKWDGCLGGTEVLQALQYAYSMPMDPARPRQILLLTDGDVDNQAEVMSLVALYGDRVRISVVGIGNGVSRALVEGIVRAGRGDSIFVTEKEDVTKKTMRLMKHMRQPCLYDVRIVAGPDSVAPLKQWTSTEYIYGDTIGFLYAIFPSTSDLSGPPGPSPVSLVPWLRVTAKTTSGMGPLPLPPADGSLYREGKALLYREVEFAVPRVAVEPAPAEVQLDKQAMGAYLQNLEHAYDLVSGRTFDQLTHPLHPAHPLLRVRPTTLASLPGSAWTCDACKVLYSREEDAGARMRCPHDTCDFDLCATCMEKATKESRSLSQLDELKKEAVAVSVQQQIVCKFTRSVLVVTDSKEHPREEPIHTVPAGRAAAGAEGWGSMRASSACAVPAACAGAAFNGGSSYAWVTAAAPACESAPQSAPRYKSKNSTASWSAGGPESLRGARGSVAPAGFGLAGSVGSAAGAGPSGRAGFAGACGPSGPAGIKNSKWRNAALVVQTGGSDEDEEESCSDEESKEVRSQWVMKMLAMQEANGSWVWSESLCKMLMTLNPSPCLPAIQVLLGARTSMESYLKRDSSAVSVTEVVVGTFLAHAPESKDEWEMAVVKARAWLKQQYLLTSGPAVPRSSSSALCA